MTVSRPPELRVGDELLVGASAHTVAAVSGQSVVLTDVNGVELRMTLAELFAASGLGVLSQSRAPLPGAGLLDAVAETVVEQARWWEHHIVEVLVGVPPEAGPGAVPRPGYDLRMRTLRQREQAKVDELATLGHAVALRRLQRLRRSYEQHGVWGLVDHRSAPRRSPRTDQRVLDAIAQAVGEETDRSTGTVDRLRRRVQQILAAEHGPDSVGLMPSRATFYRLVKTFATGKHTFGSARTRRSLAKQPAGPFGTVSALRPGEWMQIDSTPLDIAVLLEDGVIDRAELTWLIDCATRTIPAAVLCSTTKAVDASLLLARSLSPEPMRPGWADALRMARSVLPHRQLVDIDARLEHAAARPVIVPETIVCDHGKVYMSQNFRGACRAMGINVQPSHEGSPWEKGSVETSFAAVGTLFAQYVAGYLGSSVERRGEHAERQAVWSILELQDLLDEWLVACWQNRPHDGLRHPLIPDKALSPNEMYAALVQTAGYVPVPLTQGDYIELLPVTWRAINSYGVKIKHRCYDGKALNPYRRQHSGVEAKKGLWEVHHDPYDVTRIWIRNHHGTGWIQACWTQLRSAPVPFGEQAWDHARAVLARRGADPATEQEITQAVHALLDKAEHGPTGGEQPSAKDKRVAARTRAATARARTELGAPETDAEADPSSVPRSPAPDRCPVHHDAGDDDNANTLAKVIPLGIFDPFAEAQKRW